MNNIDKTAITINTYNKYAKAYEEKFMDVSSYKYSLDKFVSLIPDKAKILDIACGPGNIARYLVEKNRNFDILGIDLSEAMIKLAQANVPSADFIVQDIRKLNIRPETYDAAIASFCLPFLTNKEAKKLFKNISSLLKPNPSLSFITQKT